MLETKDILSEFLDLPKFDDGRINFKNSVRAPVFSCVLECGGKILLLKRSGSVGTYKEKWNFITSYIDSLDPLDYLVYKELEEELDIKKEYIKSLLMHDSWHYEDTKVGRAWIIYPVLAKCRHSHLEIHLNWENTQWKWVFPHEVMEHDTVPGLDKDLDIVFEGKDWRKRN